MCMCIDALAETLQSHGHATFPVHYVSRAYGANFKSHPSMYLTTSLVERLALLALYEEFPGSIPGGTSLGNVLFYISSHLGVLDSAH